ncbi:MAG: hypothetical protein GX093_03845 [Xanthomonadaceae bacterium]|nr:hypothetical protein [Xanthomonadaceae bacterium]
MKHRALAAVSFLGLLASLGWNGPAQAENTDRSKAEPACRNEAVIFCENWEDGDWVGWKDYNAGDSLNRGGYRGGLSCADGSCLLPYPGYNNSKAVALVIPQDAPDAIYPRAPFNEQVGPNETLYVRWRAYWSPNFHFNYQNTKHFYLLSNARSNSGGGGTYRVGFFVRPPVKGGDPQVAVPYIHVYKHQVELAPGSWQSQVGESDVRYFPNQPGTEDFRIVGGRWYEIEMRVTPNPRGQAFGGRLQFWIDGKLMADYTDNVSVRKANDPNSFDGVWLSTYFGGGGQSTHPEQYVLYDDIIVSRARIGSSARLSPPSSPTMLRAE